MTRERDDEGGGQTGGLGDALLDRVLTDPATGLPSVAYFRVIREWEERQARRYGGHVRVVRVIARGGEERVRRSLSWRLCSEFRTSDLIAAAGPGEFRILLTSPDTGHADALVDRLQRLADALNELHPAGEPLTIAVVVEEERIGSERGPCALPDRAGLDTPPSQPRFPGPADGDPSDASGPSGRAPAREPAEPPGRYPADHGPANGSDE